MGESYEAMVLEAHLPNRVIAFSYEDGGPNLSGGVFEIRRVRTATKEDLKKFACRAHEDACPLCNRKDR